MLFEGECPKCGGPATNMGGVVSCSLCGDYVPQEGEEAPPETVQASSEPAPLGEQLGAVTMTGLGELASVQPPVRKETYEATLEMRFAEAVDCLLDETVLARLPSLEDPQFGHTVTRAFEFFLGYIEGDDEGLPAAREPQNALKVPLRPLVSQWATFQELNSKFGVPEVELMRRAISLYLDESGFSSRTAPE